MGIKQEGVSEKKSSSNGEQLTLELTMVLWMPLSLILMVICLSDRSGLMNGGWILIWGFFFGSNMYLHKNKQQAWTVLSLLLFFFSIFSVSITIEMFSDTVPHWKQPEWHVHNSSKQQCTITVPHIKVYTAHALYSGEITAANWIHLSESLSYSSLMVPKPLIFSSMWETLCFM